VGDIKSPTLLFIKGGLMFLVGLTASAILLLRHPDWLAAGLLATAVWGFCRAYYFAFYVIDHYIDPGSRYAGLMDFIRRSMGKSWKPRA